MSGGAIQTNPEIVESIWENQSGLKSQRDLAVLCCLVPSCLDCLVFDGVKKNGTHHKNREF